MFMETDATGYMSFEIGALIFWGVLLFLRAKENEMDILVMSIVAGLVVIGGIWMVTRDTKPEEKHQDDHRIA